METAEIAEGLVRQTLEGVIAPGTVRHAKNQEEAVARCVWPVVTLEQLEQQLSKHPEQGVLLESDRPIKIILQSVSRSGTGNQCKVLVARERKPT